MPWQNPILIPPVSWALEVIINNILFFVGRKFRNFSRNGVLLVNKWLPVSLDQQLSVPFKLVYYIVIWYDVYDNLLFSTFRPALRSKSFASYRKVQRRICRTFSVTAMKLNPAIWWVACCPSADHWIKQQLTVSFNIIFNLIEFPFPE